ncbi:MAG: heat-inducible transcription repressor HrcA [Clostridiales bacterium]|nr:heat-inducible transcription repressor HrcA [Clostridiales bacterium]
MGLTSRKEKILQAIVDGYIENPQPVSSAEIKEKHLPALSSATIRNEMAALEEMGYLTQPHASSGRVPTAEAYRLYVEKLMPRRKLSRSELKIVKRYFNRKVTEIDDMLKSTAKVISEITNLTSVAYLQSADDATVTNIRLVKISASSALIIIVTNLGVLKDTTINIGDGVTVTDEYCDRASKFVTQFFGGRKISEINRPKKIIKEVKKEYHQVFKTIIKIFKSYDHDEVMSDIILEGSAKILEQPEYANLQKAKAMLEFLDAKEELVPVLQNSDDMNITFKIGRDNELRDGMPECAIVTAQYSINGVTVGNAGVIGPIRMDYGKVVSVLDYLSRTVQMLPAGEGREGDIESVEVDDETEAIAEAEDVEE